MKKYNNPLEPFANGYLNCEVEDIEYKIASGICERMKSKPIFLNADSYFAGWFDRAEEVGARFVFGDGLEVKEDIFEKEIKDYPEYSQELKDIFEKIAPLDSRRLVRESKTVVETNATKMYACWGGDWGGHGNPDYYLLLHEGTSGIRKKIEKFRKINIGKDVFYDSLFLVLDGFDLLAQRYRDIALKNAEKCSGEQRAHMQRIANALENVPKNPPRDFFEACQMFWLVFTSEGIDSPGRFDMFMIDYYNMSDKNDRSECLEKLWDVFHQTRTWNLCISGSDEFWNDQSNELTYDILETARKYRYNTPNLTVRVHRNTPERLWKSIAETIAVGIGMPVIYNDEVVCPALEALGIPASDSHCYCMNGCNQFDIFGKSHMGLEDGEVNLAKCLELTLNNGICTISGEKIGCDCKKAESLQSFDELYNEYIKQLDFITDMAVDMSNKAQRIYAQYAPNPQRSNLLRGCIEKGLDYKNGGPIYGHGQILAEGIADTADSLAAVKHFVFDTSKYSMTELLNALRADFDGYEELHKDFSNYHKFGNNQNDVDEIAAKIVEHYNLHLLTKNTFRGGKFGGGCSPFSRAANNGLHVGALPNGRKKGTALFADSIGSVPGMDSDGPTSLINSVLKYNQYLAKSGFILNLKFNKELFGKGENIDKFISLAKTYLENGGQQLSVLVISAEELLDAKIHPELHKNLIVRVGGYSDYFNNLSSDLQDNVISRTLINI